MPSSIIEGRVLIALRGVSASVIEADVNYRTPEEGVRLFLQNNRMPIKGIL
jgi:hypothetical protein